MTFESEFMEWYDESIYQECVFPFTSKVDAMVKAAAPDYRDLKKNSYAAVEKAPNSNERQAVVFIRSDGQEPDVFGTAGYRSIAGYQGVGRPAGSRNGVRSTVQPYSNGVDLANISNGAQNGRSRRRTPMPTAGWWDDFCREVDAL